MKYYILLIGAVLTITSCVKHEVIPPPTPPVPVVEFDCWFLGDVDGTSKSLISGQNGFYCNQLNTIYTTTNQPTEGVWYNEVLHGSSQESIRLTHGELSWPAENTLPSTYDWKQFYLTNQSPIIANDGVDGVEITYVDNGGTEFKTQDTSIYPSTIAYTFVESDSASNGLFVKFTATVDCKVYSQGGSSKLITGGTMKGAYKYN